MMCDLDIDIFSFIKDFLDSPRLSRMTAKSYLTGLNAFRRWCNDRHLSRPTAQDIATFRSWLLSRYRVTTAQTYLVSVKLFFSWLDKHCLYQDVATDVQGVRVNHNVPMRDHLSLKEVRMLLARLSDQKTKTGSLRDIRNYAMVLLILTCGLRVSEVVKLDVDDLYWSSGTYCLQIHGKGRDGKSDSVNVPDAVARLVFHWLEIRFPPSDGNPSMFISLGYNNASGRLCSRTVSQIVKQSLKKSGFDSPRLTAHSLRHSAITLALLGGTTLQQTQQFARHSRMETTQIYAHNLEILRNPCSRLIADMALGHPTGRLRRSSNRGTLAK